MFNENTPRHLSPTRGAVTNHAHLPPPSLIPNPSLSPDSHSTLNTPHTALNLLPIPSLTEIITNRDLITRTTRSTSNSLPKTSRHYNDIDPITLFISLNAAHDISPPSTPDIALEHTSLLHDCFLSAPLPFLRIRSWDLSKPPVSYHEATSRPDLTVWLAAMQQVFKGPVKRPGPDRTLTG